MDWLVFQMATTIIRALGSILDKHMSGEQRLPPQFYLASFGLVSLPVASVGVAGWVPLPTWSDLTLAVVGGICFAFAVIVYYRAVALDEISRLVPLLRLSSLMTLVLSALLFGERLRPTHYLAFGVMLIGSGLLVVRSAGGKWHLGRGALLMLATAMLLSLDSTLTAQVYYRYPRIVAFVAERLGVVVGTALVLLLTPNKRPVLRRVRSLPFRLHGMVIGEQTMRLVAGFLSSFVLVRVGSAALVGVMGGLTPFFVWILARVLLKEPCDRRSGRLKLIGFCCIGGGMMLLTSS